MSLVPGRFSTQVVLAPALEWATASVPGHGLDDGVNRNQKEVIEYLQEENRILQLRRLQGNELSLLPDWR